MLWGDIAFIVRIENSRHDPGDALAISPDALGNVTLLHMTLNERLVSLGQADARATDRAAHDATADVVTEHDAIDDDGLKNGTTSNP